MQLTLFFYGWCLVLAVMSLGWFVQYLRKDAGIVDVLWTFSVGLLAILFAILGDTFFERRLLLSAVVGAWSLRLGLYILVDRVLGKEEDGRYQHLRSHWGEKANFNFFWFFHAQGLAALFFSIPFYFIATNPTSAFTIYEVLGVLCWVIAFSGEWMSDAQLAAFRRNNSNKGKTCQVGMWKYSRHPNYFFEWLHWWSYVLMLVGVEGFYPSLLCPLVMLYSLFKVTGIPHTEAQAIRSRGEEYKDYQKRTSVFIPWFPTPKSNLC
jgi:steroid 5-alpha reductase family enzyme